ncbi:AAA family ATPase [Peijinzhouia sedimentorum]
MNITADFKAKVMQALADKRKNFGGSDSAFANQQGINPSVFSRLKKGETEGLLKDTQWLTLGRELDVQVNTRKWNMAKTEVFDAIKADVLFCKNNAKGIVLVDDCAIGKSYSAKYLSRTVENCFYLDCSQSKTKSVFIRAMAKVLGIDTAGRIQDVKANIKYYLRMLNNPVLILDEAGDLEYTAFLELKEFWNGTEGTVGWYLMGADGLREKMERGINNRKVGYRELLSRYSDKFMKIIPTEKQDRLAFYKKMITDVVSVNVKDKSKIGMLVQKCMYGDAGGDVGGLRRLETLIILNDA